MKKILTWLLIATLLFTLCGVQALAADEDEIWGTYVLADMDDGSGTDNSEMLAMMAALGMTATLEISEDGTGRLELFGESEEFTVDFDKMTFDSDGSEIPFSYEDGVLIIADEGMSMTFTKSALKAPRGSGVFDYYVLTSVVVDGETIELPEGTEDYGMLIVFENGDGIMDIQGDTTELVLDFEEMTVAFSEDDVQPFTLEDGVLTMTEEDSALVFQLADPGFAGPYVAIAMRTEDQEEMTDELAMLAAMNMAPKLTIDEDGTGVMDVFGETVELIFDFDTMTVVPKDDEENAASFTYENGKLRIEVEETSITFARVMETGEDAEEASVQQQAGQK